MIEEQNIASVKFQCPACRGIILSEYNDDAVMCGHCDATCKVPQGFEAGVVIDDFLIERHIGSGGIGDVFQAHQLSLDRKVALKILHADFLEDAKFKNDFVYEARSVARLNHINIVQAYKVGEEAGNLFFAMELIEGSDLKSVLKDVGRLDETTIRGIAANIAVALGYAWDTCKLVHRDIKPDNIMVNGKGEVKLMDLGLSLRDGENFDGEDRISGSLPYISPEQVGGYDVDLRTDFYSLGATLFTLASGRHVFQSNDVMELLEMHVNTKPEMLHDLIPDITLEFSKIVNKLLAKDIDKRYQTVEELLEDLTVVPEIGPKKKAKKKLSLKGGDSKKSTRPGSSSRGGDSKKSTRPGSSSRGGDSKKSTRPGTRGGDSRKSNRPESDTSKHHAVKKTPLDPLVLAAIILVPLIVAGVLIVVFLKK
jgi:serine/threonine protein kinase